MTDALNHNSISKVKSFGMKMKSAVALVVMEGEIIMVNASIMDNVKTLTQEVAMVFKQEKHGNS